MGIYYWDFKFDFDKVLIDVGLVQAQSGGGASDITGKCVPSANLGLTYHFNQGDQINFNIFDGSGGCALEQASIVFTNGSSPFSLVSGNDKIYIAKPAVTPDGRSAAFGGAYSHWMFPEYAIVAASGNFPFRISLEVTRDNVKREIGADPEMIVGTGGAG